VNKIKRIDISGRIIRNNEQRVYDYYGYDATSPAKVRKMLQEAGGQPIEVYFNSGGGDVYAGSEIYTELKEYKGKSVGKVVGVAASSASVAAMGVQTLLLSPTSQLMIHNAATGTWGDKNEHKHSFDMLNVTDRAIANAYLLKTGKSKQEIMELMNKESFFTAEDAVALGFADGIMFDENNQLSAVASLHNEGALPSLVIEKFHNEIINLINRKGEDETMKDNNTHTTTAPVAAAAATPPSAVQTMVVPVPPVAQPVATIDYAAQERERLKGIDAIAANIDADLVNDAKYNNPITAEQLAFKAMKEGKLLNAGLFNQAVEANRSAGTDQVQAQAQAVQQTNDPDVDLSNMAGVNSIFQALAANAQANRQQGRGQ